MTIDERLEALAVNIESLHSNIHQLWETVQNGRADSERRLRAVEDATREMKDMSLKLTDTMNRLANIVIRHEERLDAIDGGDR